MNMKRLIALALALVLSLALAACGSSAAPSPSASAPAESAPAESASAESDLDYVKGKGALVIGYTVYAPMNYTDDNGEFTGFDTELAKAVCERLGVEPQFQEIVWETKEIELAGKTMGIIGFGRIGQAEGRIAKALGMNVLAYDLYPNDTGRAIAEYVALDELYARVDVITLHCNLTPENTGMINKDSIAKMKDGVILINNARGQLIDEQDVADALNCGKMAAAGLDVVYTEPIRADNPLLKAKNCIITPHISWAPKESRQRIMDCTVENIRAFLAGAPVNVVNR